jgi:hypothetical protein
MSVGGHIIEMHRVALGSGEPAVRLRVMDTTHHDETFVYAEPWADGEGPRLREMVWWQAGRIYFDGDRRSVRKIGFSGDAHFSDKATQP